MNPNRLTRFRDHLSRANLAGAVIRRPANVYYLTGYPASVDRPSFAVVGKDAVVLVAPGDAGALRASVGDEVGVVGYAAPGSTLDRMPDIDAPSARALEQAVDAAGLAGETVGLDPFQVSAAHAAVVAARAQVGELGDALDAMRRIKEPEEIERIRATAACNDVGFAAASRTIREGISEFEVMNAVVAAMEEATGVPIDLLGATNAFISGQRTLLAAASATARRLEGGDLMILDLNPFLHHYKADTTRTFCVGRPTPEQQAVHDALVRGLEAAERAVRPGMSGGDLFAALVRPIVDAGFGSLKFHGGHGIGLEHLERPYIIPSEEMPLREGMVIALEPGVYIQGIGGLRVEDNYVVTTSGLEPLSHFPRRLTGC